MYVADKEWSSSTLLTTSNHGLLPRRRRGFPPALPLPPLILQPFAILLLPLSLSSALSLSLLVTHKPQNKSKNFSNFLMESTLSLTPSSRSHVLSSTMRYFFNKTKNSDAIIII